MLPVLEQHIRNRISLSRPGQSGLVPDEAQLAEVLSHFTFLKVKRNELLLREGEVCRLCYFVAKGCIQVFTYDRNGEESTRDIVVENNNMIGGALMYAGAFARDKRLSFTAPSPEPA